jgi:hypothetical protein
MALIIRSLDTTAGALAGELGLLERLLSESECLTELAGILSILVCLADALPHSLTSVCAVLTANCAPRSAVWAAETASESRSSPA